MTSVVSSLNTQRKEDCLKFKETVGYIVLGHPGLQNEPFFQKAQVEIPESYRIVLFI